MLEFLKEKGNALKNFLDKDDDEKEETKSAVEELIEFQKAKTYLIYGFQLMYLFQNY